MKNEKRQAFYPGKVWLDTEGKRIQAHGGSVMYIVSAEQTENT